MKIILHALSTSTLVLLLINHAVAGPKGTLKVPRLTSPITVDGDFSDWPTECLFNDLPTAGVSRRTRCRQFRQMPMAITWFGM